MFKPGDEVVVLDAYYGSKAPGFGVVVRPYEAPQAGKVVVLLDGMRIPFQETQVITPSQYRDLYQAQREAFDRRTVAPSIKAVEKALK